MIVYVCDLCKSTVFQEDIYFIEATKGRNRYSFDLCDRCYRKLFKDVRKRKEDQELTLEVFEDESDI